MNDVLGFVAWSEKALSKTISSLSVPFPSLSLPPFSFLPLPHFPSLPSLLFPSGNFIHKLLAKPEPGGFQQRGSGELAMVAQSGVLVPKPGENGTHEEKGWPSTVLGPEQSEEDTRGDSGGPVQSIRHPLGQEEVGQSRAECPSWCKCGGQLVGLVAGVRCRASLWDGAVRVLVYPGLGG